MILHHGGNTRFVSDSSGNVGIGGDTTPDAILEIRNISSSDLFMASSGTDTDGDRFIIKNSGKVGIGTTNPSYQLHVVSSSSDPYIKIGDGTRDSGVIIHSSGGSTVALRVGSGTNKMFLHDNDVSINSFGYVGINTSASYPLEVNAEVSGISIYALKNVSATGYITRTSVFDKSKDVWDYIKDADDYLSEGEIDHKEFYGYAGEFEITDYSRPEIEEYPCIDEEEKETTCERTVYPYTKIEEGVILDAEVDLLRQAIYELKEENDVLKAEICILNPLSIMCK